MRAKQLGKTLNSRELNALIHPLRYLDNYTNLIYLLGEYLTLLAAIGGTVAFCHWHSDWGFAWYWCIPVVLLEVVIVGAVQHRFAGLAHEGSHYMLLKNRFWNELVSDVFCMFPLLSTTAQYRLIHLGHHEYTNDWNRDPELLNLGKTRLMDRFPMTRGEFVYHFLLRILWPPASARYLWDNLYISILGHGTHPYNKHAAKTPARGRIGQVRITTLLGIAFSLSMVGIMGYLSWYGTFWQLALTPLALWLGAVAVIAAIPTDWFFQSDLRPVISSKMTSVLRLGYFILWESVFAWARAANGVEWGVYFWLLWILPLTTTWPYYMLLRDIYQHANADDGKLTNSRVIFTNPITRWAMFIYGQDIHLTHHLYPAVPHYNLRKLHRLLMEHSPEYAENVVECHGILHNKTGELTALDCMEIPTREPEPRPSEAPVADAEIFTANTNWRASA